MASEEKTQHHFTEIIVVLVGDQQTKFMIHPRVLIPRSRFSEAALRRWKRAGEPVILVDDCAEIFDLYMRTVYGGTLQGLEDENNCIDYENLISIFILADKLGDLDMANEAVDYIKTQLNFGRSSPNPATIFRAWDSTSDGSPLRRLIVDYYSSRLDIEQLCTDMQSESAPKDLLSTLARGFARAWYESAPRHAGVHITIQFRRTNACAYHQHDSTHPSIDNCVLLSEPPAKAFAEEEPNPGYGLFD